MIQLAVVLHLTLSLKFDMVHIIGSSLKSIAFVDVKSNNNFLRTIPEIKRSTEQESFRIKITIPVSLNVKSVSRERGEGMKAIGKVVAYLRQIMCTR